MRAFSLGIILCLAILVSCFSQAQGETVLRELKILNSGEFVPDSDPPYAKLSKSGDTILAAPGKRFGLEFMPLGTPKGAPLKLILVVTRSASEDKPAEQFQRFILACIGERVVATWTFGNDLEPASGQWEFSLLYAGASLASHGFTLANPNAQAKPGQTAPEPAPSLAKAQADGPAQATAPSPPSMPTQAAQAQVKGQAAVPTPSAKEAQAAQVQASLPVPAAVPSLAAKPEVLPRKPAPQPAPSQLSEVYVLQAGAFGDEQNARQLAAHLAKLGFKPCLFREKTPKGLRFVVLAGKYNSLEQAKKAKQSYQAREKTEPILKKSSAQDFGTLNCR